MGALIFHVGRSHETASTGGITHLVEHLALAPLTQRDHPHNGFVGDWRTVFHAGGTDEELTDFFGRVTASLGNLPLDRLAMERRILRQEAADRDPGIVARLLWYRYGNRGHGLVGTQELGLEWLGPAPVAEWAATRFGRSNVAAWFSGEPPAGLRFHLPDGQPSVPASLDPIDDLALPAHLAWEPPGSAMSYLVPRSAAAVLTMVAAARRAREILRFERGLVYDVLSDYEPLDGTAAHVYFGADCASQDSVTVRETILRTLDEIAADGLTEEELRRELRQYRDSLEVPQAILGTLDSITTSHVLGRPYEDRDAITAEYEATTPAITADGLAAALPTTLLTSPGGTPTWRDLTPYPVWSSAVVEGRESRPAGWPLRNRKRQDRLRVGADGVSWLDGYGHQLTVRYDDCVAYRHWDGDRRELRSGDGFTVRLAADDWQGGAEVIRRIDAAVPPHVIVCGEHNAFGMEDPSP
jgi:hypothetical protein